MGQRVTLVGSFFLSLTLTMTACGGASLEAQSPPGSGSAATQGPSDSAAAPAGDAQQVAAGKELFAARCQACHGVEGVGERPEDPMAVDANSMPLAPALDDSMHAWHHTDDGLVTMILEGSSRNPRMVAWSQTGLTEAEARAIVAFMKSLWGEVARRCQGPLHMDRACVMGLP